MAREDTGRKATQRRGRGQPTKLTEECLRKVLRARQLGMGLVASCNAAGIDPGTHRNWMLRGEDDAKASRPTLYAEYFIRVPVAADEGVFIRRDVAQRILRNKKAKPEDVQRAKLALAYEAMVEAGKMGAARRAALKKGLTEHGEPQAPAGAPAVEERPVPVELSRLSAEDFARYQELAAKARTSLTALTTEEFSQLQALLRKASGEDALTPPAPQAETGGAVPAGSTDTSETSRAPHGDAPPTAP